MSVTLRLDKDFPSTSGSRCTGSLTTTSSGGQRNASAALAYAYLVTTGWLDGSAVGTLTVWSDGVNFAWLDDLVVHPAYRRRGIGTRLVTESLARLASDGISAVQVLAIRGREPFFAGLGFTIQEDARVMDLVIRSTPSQRHCESRSGAPSRRLWNRSRWPTTPPRWHRRASTMSST